MARGNAVDVPLGMPNNCPSHCINPVLLLLQFDCLLANLYSTKSGNEDILGTQSYLQERLAYLHSFSNEEHAVFRR